MRKFRFFPCHTRITTRASTKGVINSPSRYISYDAKTLYRDNPLLLPRLPIPDVTQTLQRYSETLFPLKPEAEVNAHLRKLQAFQSGSAQRLNRQLRQIEKKASKKAQYPYNFIEQLWDDGYLAFRGPSPINISPALTLRPIKRIDNSQCGVAAEYVYACLRWYEKFVSGELDIFPKKEDGRLNDLSQLPSQFGCCRIPQPGKDTKCVTMWPKHIIVLYRGHTFEVDLADNDGLFYSPPALASAFSHLISSTTNENPYPIGVLSTGGRTDYAGYIEEISGVSSETRQLLNRVFTAFMTVCLDLYTASDLDAKVQAVLHGIGCDRNNRWFDRHQLIVSKDGCVGLNLEHAFSDGVTWERWIDEVWNHLNGTLQHTAYTPLPALEISKSDRACYRLLEFRIPSSFQGVFSAAKQSWKNAAKNVYQGIIVSDIGRKRIKQYRVSPDAFVQMAFQLAFFRLSGRMAPTQEYVSASTFFHGRTETVRSATREMTSFVRHKALDETTEVPANRLDEVYGLAHLAAAKHSSLIKLAAEGNGIDRHLQALKSLAATEKETMDAEQFFNDLLYGYSGNWQMSTANASASFVEAYCFGPVVEHGYGLGYVIHEDRITCAVSSFISSRKSSGSRMCEAVRQAMRDISVVLGCREI